MRATTVAATSGASPAPGWPSRPKAPSPAAVCRASSASLAASARDAVMTSGLVGLHPAAAVARSASPSRLPTP
jgi:hypothetical protein